MAFHMKIFSIRKWLLLIYIFLITMLVIQCFLPFMKWLIVCVFIILIVMDGVIYYFVIPLNSMQYFDDYLQESFNYKNEGYFNNDNPPSRERLLLNLLESIFFTNKLCKYEIIIKMIGELLFIYFFIIFVRQEDIVLSIIICIILILKLVELIKYKIFLRLSTGLYNKILNEAESKSICNFVYYSNLKTLFKIYPSTYLFNFLNDRLSTEWEKEKTLWQDHMGEKKI